MVSFLFLSSLLFVSFLPIASAGYVPVVREFYLQIDIQRYSPQLVVVMGNLGPTEVVVSGIEINNKNVLSSPKPLSPNENTTITVSSISQALGNNLDLSIGIEFANAAVKPGPSFQLRRPNFYGTFHMGRKTSMQVPVEVPAPNAPSWLHEGVNANYSLILRKSSGTFNGFVSVNVDSINLSDRIIVLSWIDTVRGVTSVSENYIIYPLFSGQHLYFTPASLYAVLHPIEGFMFNEKVVNVSTETVFMANSTYETVIIQMDISNLWISYPDGLMLKAGLDYNNELIEMELLSTNIVMIDDNDLDSTVSDNQGIDFLDPIMLSGIVIAVAILILVTVFLRYKR